MKTLDQILILLFLVITLKLGLKREKQSKSSVDYLLAGRKLTLPAFVATMVSTWYGGILGVGEYTYLYGISNWLVFGVPYYLAALIFARFLAQKAQKSRVLTLPEQMEKTYGKQAGNWTAWIVLIISLPAAYVLTFGILLHITFDLDLNLAVILGTLFSIAYLWKSGFKAVVRTDGLQVALMYGGFAMLLSFLVFKWGLHPLKEIPSRYWTWHGGASLQSILSWYIIALTTLVAPSFYQRCFAAQSPDIAQKGLYLSVLAWFVFDLMTTFSGLYAKALLPELSLASEAFPKLAQWVLPAGALGFFYMALMATVLSTIDSYLFIAASTLGRDIFQKKSRFQNDIWAVRWAYLWTGLASIALALTSKSVVQLWKILGTIGTIALLFPLLGTFWPKWKFSPQSLPWAMGLSLFFTLIWSLGHTYAHWPIEPIFIGLLVNALVWTFEKISKKFG